MNSRKLQRALGLLGALFLALATLFLLFYWQQIPDSVPRHFNRFGAADAYDHKSILLMPLFLGWMLYALLFFVGTAIRELPAGDAEVRPCSAMAGMIAALQAWVSLAFAYTILCGALCRDLGVWFVPVFLSGAGAAILAGVVSALRRR